MAGEDEEMGEPRYTTSEKGGKQRPPPDGKVVSIKSPTFGAMAGGE
jgi:hypothetical protein